MTNSNNYLNYVKKGIIYSLAIAFALWPTNIGHSEYQKLEKELLFKKITFRPQIISLKNPLEDLIIFPNKVEIPKSPKYKLGNLHCAKYAVKSAEDLYGKKFISSNAWNLRYNNKIISEVENPNHLERLVNEGILKPGMIVGTTNPKSQYNNRKDQTGKKVKYTNVALFIGRNEDRELEFIHQRESITENIILQRLLEMKLTPVEILDDNTTPSFGVLDELMGMKLVVSIK